MKLVILLVISFFWKPVQSEGDLTKQVPIEFNLSLKGEKGKGHYFSPSKLKFKTGNLHKLVILNESKSKHYFTSNGFSKSIFTRKVQVLQENGKKSAEIKGIINEIEIFPGQKVEWWFVPIKTGIFLDLNCRIIDEVNNKKHSLMGMTGTIIIY